MALLRTVTTHLGTITMKTRGKGPDLLLLHSLLTGAEAFDQVAPTLARRFTVHQVDLPGFGGSTPGSDRIDDLAHTLGSLFTEGQLGPDTCVVGNGFGGFAALGTAVHYGSRFDRLLLLGCGAGFPPEGKRAFAAMAALVEEGGMAAVVETALRRIFTEDYIARHPQEADQRRRVLAEIPVDSFVNGCRALMEVDYQPQLTQVVNPTLIVTGAEDQATPPILGEELARNMPRATFRLLPGLAHAPHLQDPEALVASVRDFLDLET